MIQFVNEVLRDKTNDLIKFCEENGITHYLYDFYDDKDEEELITIDYGSDFEFFLPRDDESYSIKLIDAFDLRNNILNSELDGHIYRSKNKFIMRVASSELRYEKFVKIMETIFTYNGKKYKIWVSKKSVEYAVSISVNKKYHKYIPPTLVEDLFINVYCEDGLDKNIDSIIERYLFEVDSTFGIQLFPSPRPEYIDDYEEDEDNIEDGRKIINAEVDDKLTEVLSIFNKASNIESIELKILNYTRVIEYVSQTVIKKDLFDSVFNKLSSNRVHSPDSDYILELEQIFKDNNKYSKDSEAIKITVKKCCDAMNLKLYAPKFLKKINKLKTDSKKSEQLEALEELGESISDTRNMFSHAKTNYNKKGRECPKEDLFEFGECLKAVANQVIRWYARQSNTYIIK